MSVIFGAPATPSRGLPTEPRGFPPGTPEGASTPPPQRKGCSCCGCSGCFLSCVVLIIIVPAVVAMLVFFSPGLGDSIDRFAILFYRQQGRSLILENPGIKGTPQEKRQYVALIDELVVGYENLPDEDRRAVRTELLWALYYDVQNKKPPPEKVQNLNRFIENQTRLLQQKNPQLNQ